MGGGGVSSSGGDQRRGGENWRGGGDYAKSSCSAEVNIRSESNEPSLSQINIECPIGCEGLIFQKLVFVEIENTQGSPIKTEDIKKVDFHVISPLKSILCPRHKNTSHLLQ